MASKVALGRLALLPPGEGRTFEVHGRRIAVFHTRDGGVYATQAECPHRQGPLADGLVGGSVVICPLHEWKFDLKSGQVLSGDCALRTYPISESDDGMLMLEWNDE
jgi:nitrite reductase (NADH) small subunit